MHKCNEPQISGYAGATDSSNFFGEDAGYQAQMLLNQISL
jgi:hypothetical protein